MTWIGVPFRLFIYCMIKPVHWVIAPHEEFPFTWDWVKTGRIP